jgi:hypothetical protein
VLIDYLRANAETFAWSLSDMPGIPRDVAEHSLDIRAGARPVKQPLRHFDEEKRRAIGEEIHKLMVVGFIKEVFHPEWLTNLVLMKKKGGKWRMCIDYTGLNKACPKVPYPLPRIDQFVDSTAGCEILSFLDAYSGYHQIKMKESDQLATSFITPFSMYCYTTMPFGLRNAGATYQRCMNHVFGEHIGQTLEAYVDDIVVKTRKASDLLSDLETTFKCLRAKGVKLNPEKCVFGVPRGMLLGFIVSERGIEANPEKIMAITNMGSIKDLKGVQRVMGCLAALSRFISRLDEKGLPLYRLLRKAERFTWTPETEEALGNLKALLTNAPILVPPPRYGRSPLDLRSRNHSGGQRHDHSRVTRRRACTARPEAGLLHQRSVIRDHDPLPTNLEATVRSNSDVAKIATLLRVSSGDCGVILPLGGDHPVPRGLG